MLCRRRTGHAASRREGHFPIRYSVMSFIFHKGIIFFDMGKIKENHIDSMDFSVYMEGVSVILQQGDRKSVV